MDTLDNPPVNGESFDFGCCGTAEILHADGSSTVIPITSISYTLTPMVGPEIEELRSHIDSAFAVPDRYLGDFRPGNRNIEGTFTTMPFRPSYNASALARN